MAKLDGRNELTFAPQIFRDDLALSGEVANDCMRWVRNRDRHQPLARSSLARVTPSPRLDFARSTSRKCGYRRETTLSPPE